MSTATEPAEVKTIPAAEYHADHSHVSNSMLKQFSESRRKYHGLFVDGSVKPDESTKAMDTGTVGHAAILEPHIIDGVCLEIPADALNSQGHRKGKAWTEFRDSNSDRILMTAKDLGKVRAMYESVMANEHAGRLLGAGGVTERSIFWTCPTTGLPRKCRPDYLLDGWVVDIKTSEDVSPHWFSNYTAKFKYYRQGPYYQDAGEAVQGERPVFAIVAVCTKPPHVCCVYEINSKALELGKFENLYELRQLEECLKTGDWREPEEKQITVIDLPRWAYTTSKLEA